MKPCIKCGKIKPLEEFHRGARMADGHMNKCKPCVLEYCRKHRAKNINRIRAYDRERGLLPSRKKANRLRYKIRTKTKAGKKKEVARSKEWALRNRVKRAVHIITGSAIKSGRLLKQPCERCGSTRFIHAHHEDYGRPLDVTWLCKKCHGERHREINEERRAK